MNEATGRASTWDTSKMPRGKCISVDLEIHPQTNHLNAIAALRSDTGQRFSNNRSPGQQQNVWVQLDQLARGASLLVGHNIIAFDLPHIRAFNPDSQLLKLPVVDTLKLSPLAFPKNPYHHLVKHYQDGGLIRGQINNPLLDAELTLQLFKDEQQALQDVDEDLLAAWHWLSTVTNQNTRNAAQGFDLLFQDLRKANRPSDDEARQAIANRLLAKACTSHSKEIIENCHLRPWELSYALAWISVAGTDSAVPPWVNHQFPDTKKVLGELRDTACGESGCQWCSTYHNPSRELKRWFGFDGFRSEPRYVDGRSMQQTIVEKAMQGDHLLAILPTSGGKSICYQLPALSRYDKLGGITVVISPLVALMQDQVTNMEKQGIDSCVTINGNLSMPERAEALERVRLGQTSLLLISPEQLRSRTVERSLAQREIAGWVLDEAHCLSKWGHDFRPDYRYIGKFIAKMRGDNPTPPVLCLTATAKPDVKQEIVDYFREYLQIEVETLDGGTQRDNLDFYVVRTSTATKLDDIFSMIEFNLPGDEPGGAIIYCATRSHTQQVAQYLQDKGIVADHFHAGLSSERKQEVQERFINGDLKVIAATNAFGMGIDKPDVRLVVHADIPGSLENYLQEAGRAGRDSEAAKCILLYTEEDIERQFGMGARARLNRSEINAVLKALRKIDSRNHRRENKGIQKGEVIATTGEILLEEDDLEFQRDSQTDDTRMRTAVGWLEEATLLERSHNEVNVYPASLMISSVQQVRERLNAANLQLKYRGQLEKIAHRLIDAPPDTGISTDELMTQTGMSPAEIRKAMQDLSQLGIVSDDTAITAFVHQGIARDSIQRFHEAAGMEEGLIRLMQEQAPDQKPGETEALHLRVTTQMLKSEGHARALPQLVQRSLRSVARDGREDGQGTGSLRLRTTRTETVQVTLLREWHVIQGIAERRREAALTCVQHLISKLPRGSRGADLLAETTMGQLSAAIRFNPMLAGTQNINRLLHHALLWLHDQEVIRLNKGLTVLRPAMTIQLEEGRRNFEEGDFQPLQIHYSEQTIQVHIMSEYAEKGLASMAEAIRLTIDYFRMERDDFLNKWLASNLANLDRETTPESWNRIVESLHDRQQRRIVTDNRSRGANTLVLAGPGSGKTRVLVHRIAYLIRAKRENPRSILALAYNRHAAVQIRKRLNELVGDDSHGVTVLTCHAMAMRLTGASFSQTINQGADPNPKDFEQVLRDATDLLNDKDAAPEEADEQRERLLGGFRWILVDEYQDIKQDEYNLISAMAGRTRKDPDQKMTIFAVGDDDQNIYTFQGASGKYIKDFELEYGARKTFLTENYRSTKHIIDAANMVIEKAENRLKTDKPIQINRTRAGQKPGGAWEDIDPVSKGRVQTLPAGRDKAVQAQVAVQELQRMATLDPDWDWSRCAVIARIWETLHPVRALCELEGIPAEFANEDFTATWQLRETQELLKWVDGKPNRLVVAGEIRNWLATQPDGPWQDLLRETAEHYQEETGDAQLPTAHFKEWLAEWARGNRSSQHGLLLTSAHSAKGLEFDHVVVLDGEWQGRRGEEKDASRRLYYVAMTRAKKTLTLCELGTGNTLLKDLAESPATLVRDFSMPQEEPPVEIQCRYQALSLRDVDLSYVGRTEAGHQIHRAIAKIRTGEPLQVVRSQSPWLLTDKNGVTVGRMSRAFTPKDDTSKVTATVLAVAKWDKAKSTPEFQRNIRNEDWEVVIPELVYREINSK